MLNVEKHLASSILLFIHINIIMFNFYPQPTAKYAEVFIGLIQKNMVITKQMQRDLDAAVAAEWEKNQTQEPPAFEFLIDLPESWLPEWYSQTCEYTSDMEKEEQEILALYNEEFQTIWASYYEDHLSWIEEEREFYNYLRTESAYW